MMLVGNNSDGDDLLSDSSECNPSFQCVGSAKAAVYYFFLTNTHTTPIDTKCVTNERVQCFCLLRCHGSVHMGGFAILVVCVFVFVFFFVKCSAN